MLHLPQCTTTNAHNWSESQ